MARSDNLYQLPVDLPIPTDDGASDHLPGLQLPSVPLRSTGGDIIDLATLAGTTVVYAYPRTGQPDRDVPAAWNAISLERVAALLNPAHFAIITQSWRRWGRAYSD
jgi:hypothetical protein